MSRFGEPFASPLRLTSLVPSLVPLGERSTAYKFQRLIKTKRLVKKTRNPVSTETPQIKFSQRKDWAARQAIGFLMQQAIENSDCLSLAAGLVDEASLPVKPAKDALQSLFSDDAIARKVLQYGTTAGDLQLRELLLEHLAKLEGCTVDELGIDADQMVLTTGSQQFLSIIAELLFDPGDICLVAAPTYFVFLGVLEGVGANVVPVATDENGMCPVALEEELTRLEAAGQLERVKLIYLVSYYENPTGLSLAADRRQTMVDIAQRWSKAQRLLILEDAAYRELRYDGLTLPSIFGCDPTHETVILTQTFSKSFSPGVRVGFGVVPKELAKPVCDRKGNEDFGSANLSQKLLSHVIQSGQYATHVKSVCTAYRFKRDAMLAAADEFFASIPGVSWVHPDGGLYVWMTLPESIRTDFDSELFAEASKTQMVMYVPGELCYSSNDEQRPRNQMRLSFGVLSPEEIREAMRRLAQAVKTVAAVDA